MKRSIDSDTLAPFDRPIAFHPGFVKLTGSVNAALMLSQAIYWGRRTRDSEGWFYKSQEEWTKETYLTRREQEGARKLLRATGFWKERRRGNPAKMYYQILTDRFRDAVIGQSAVQTRMAETAIYESTKPPNKNGGNRHTPRARPNLKTESTSENTTETTVGVPFDGTHFLSALESFEQSRTQMNKPLTTEARRLLYKKLTDWGEVLATQALEDSVINRWQGVFEPKETNGRTQQNGIRPLDAAERNAARYSDNLEFISDLRRSRG